MKMKKRKNESVIVSESASEIVPLHQVMANETGLLFSQ